MQYTIRVRDESSGRSVDVVVAAVTRDAAERRAVETARGIFRGLSRRDDERGGMVLRPRGEIQRR